MLFDVLKIYFHQIFCYTILSNLIILRITFSLFKIHPLNSFFSVLSFYSEDSIPLYLLLNPLDFIALSLLAINSTSTNLWTSLTLSLSLSFFFFLSFFSLSLCLSLCLSLPLTLSLSSLSHSPSLSFSLSFFISLSASLSLILLFFLSLSLYLYLSPSLILLFFFSLSSSPSSSFYLLSSHTLIGTNAADDMNVIRTIQTIMVEILW